MPSEENAIQRRHWSAQVPRVFGILMVLNGIVDVFRPVPTREAMDSLSMPHYLLWILGVAKIVGGALLAARVRGWLREWAFAGFSIWFVGGLACHALSRHSIEEYAPLLGLGALLGWSLWIHRRHVVRFEFDQATKPLR